MTTEQGDNFPDHSQDFYRVSRADVILIIIVLAGSLLWILWPVVGHLRPSHSPYIALIYHAGRLLQEVSLQKDQTIALLNGHMQIEVKEGRIHVADSDCPHHLCVNMGWIRDSGQSIICVPNKVLIEVKTTGSPLLDAVAY